MFKEKGLTTLAPDNFNATDHLIFDLEDEVAKH